MARTKGSKNKNSSALPEYSALPTEEKLTIIANLIVDRIFDDQHTDNELLMELMREDHVRSNTN